MEASTDQKNFHDIMRIMAVNIGQNYFHNEYFRFAQILIMKIILTDIHGIFPHNWKFMHIDARDMSPSKAFYFIIEYIPSSI